MQHHFGTRVVSLPICTVCQCVRALRMRAALEPKPLAVSARRAGETYAGAVALWRMAAFKRIEWAAFRGRTICALLWFLWIYVVYAVGQQQRTWICSRICGVWILPYIGRLTNVLLATTWLWNVRMRLVARCLSAFFRLYFSFVSHTFYLRLFHISWWSKYAHFYREFYAFGHWWSAIVAAVGRAGSFPARLPCVRTKHRTMRTWRDMTWFDVHMYCVHVCKRLTQRTTVSVTQYAAVTRGEYSTKYSCSWRNLCKLPGISRSHDRACNVVRVPCGSD